MKRELQKIFYVYEHYKPNSSEPFYVGKGRGNRAYQKSGRSAWWHNIVNKHGFEVRFVAENLSEINAFWLENMCIKGWGRADLGEGSLVNMTDGCEGQCGAIRSKEWKKNRSDYMKGNTIKVGKPNGPEAIATQRRKVTGRKHRPETIKMMKEKALQRPKFTKEHCQNISNGLKGRKASEKTKALQSVRIKNSIWITNDNINKEIYILKTESIPTGWRRGRKKNGKYGPNKGKYRWITKSDFSESKLIQIQNEVPEGWIIGRYSISKYKDRV